MFQQIGSIIMNLFLRGRNCSVYNFGMRGSVWQISVMEVGEADLSGRAQTYELTICSDC